jgi:hypothetical protein
MGLALIGIFLITANPLTYTQAVDKGFSDVIDYMAIANSSHLDSLYPLSKQYPIHRLERWPVHFLMGQLAFFMQVDVWALERVAVVISMVFMLALIDLLRITEWQKIAIVSLLLFSPYALRQYYAAPGMLVDCLFYLTITGMAVAMTNKNTKAVIIAMCLAILLRQTGLLLIPIFVIYCWRVLSRHNLMLMGILLGTGSFLAVKGLAFLVFAPVSGDYVLVHTLGIFYWLAAKPQWHEFVDFMGRYGLMLLTLTPLLILVSRINRESLVWIIFFFFMHTQPLLAGPHYAGSNVDRLAIYGLPFLAMLLCYGSNQKRLIILFSSLIFLSSLLPNYSVLHGIPYGRLFFVTLIVGISIFSVWIHRRLGKI